MYKRQALDNSTEYTTIDAATTTLKLTRLSRGSHTFRIYAVGNYSRGVRGLYCDTAKSQCRQHPLDYLAVSYTHLDVYKRQG